MADQTKKTIKSTKKGADRSKRKTAVSSLHEKRKRTGIITVSAAVIILCGVLLLNSYRLSNQLDEYAGVEASLHEQIKEQQQESEDLDKESEYVKTEEYIEQIARERLGLVKKNEIRFEKETS